jgi:hypothetical protein
MAEDNDEPDQYSGGSGWNVNIGQIRQRESTSEAQISRAAGEE